ncbi:MAG: hypothetical protein JNK64_34840 [Myxococcales bacterium]|nr:hypothetical protein [Myxococcales bacterium]
MHRAWIPGLAIIGWASGARADAVVTVAAAAHVEVSAHVDVVVSGDGSAVVAPEAPPPPPLVPPGDAGGLTFATPLTRPHWEGELAMTLPLALGDVGLHAAIGRQVGAFRVAAEYTLSDASTDGGAGPLMAVPVDCGRQQRLGVALRYRLGIGLPELGTGLYVEAGLGRNTVAWKTRGTTRHDDVLLGVGFDMLGGGARTVGLDLGARFTLADTGGGDREATGVIALGLLVGG